MNVYHTVVFEKLDTVSPLYYGAEVTQSRHLTSTAGTAHNWGDETYHFSMGAN